MGNIALVFFKILDRLDGGCDPQWEKSEGERAFCLFLGKKDATIYLEEVSVLYYSSSGLVVSKGS